MKVILTKNDAYVASVEVFDCTSFLNSFCED